MKYNQIYLFFFICLIAASCTNKKKPDVSGIKLDIKIERFDRELDQMNMTQLTEETERLRSKYTWFYDDYMQQMLGVGHTGDPAYLTNLASVLQNEDYLELKAATEDAFPDLRKQEEDLEDAFKHILYYYPEQKIPRLISFISGFSIQTPIGNDYIGIGLDMFLGKEGERFYPSLRQSIPYYISRRFTPENISPRIIEAFIREDMFPESDKDRTLLSKMIYNGKVLYLMDKVMPGLPDSLKMGYTAEQLDWCYTHEGGIWAYLIQNELLFNSDYMQIQKYLAEAPFTPGVGEQSESAPKLGVWTGWQIVRKYMDENPDISLQQLMEEQDAQKILSESKYKPKY
jgi:gliding motility-associated lipoprotein GldB